MTRQIITALLYTAFFSWNSASLSNTEWEPNNLNEVIIISVDQPVFPNTLANRLNLSSAQQINIQKTARSAQQQLDSIHVAMQHNAYDINSAFLNHYNASQLKSLTEKQGKLYAKEMQTKLFARHQILTILTPEQHQKT